MRDYIPEARFNPSDQPIGDQRWWYKQHFEHRSDLGWQGPEPDKFSPHNLAEENEIKKAILEGRLEPRNHFEQIHRSLIAAPRPSSHWPTKWVTCRKCGCEWNCIGNPAGKQNKFTDEMAAGCYQLHDKDGYLWIWPMICQPCADRREAKPKTTVPSPAKRVTRSPIVD